jgi:hypothetical protein
MIDKRSLNETKREKTRRAQTLEYGIKRHEGRKQKNEFNQQQNDSEVEFQLQSKAAESNGIRARIG